MNQFCHGAHAEEVFATSNYGGTKTTAKDERLGQVCGGA
jgi:hypothetical protein